MQLAVSANRNYDFMTITLSTIDASRRSFLTCLSVLGISGTTLIRAGESGPHSPALVFPTAPHKRLAVTSWPFRGYIESPTNPARDRSKPGMDLKQFAAMASEKFGVPNINPLAAHFRSSEPAYLEEFRRAVVDAHSHVVDLGQKEPAFMILTPQSVMPP
jgi:hypothetical protein